MVTVTGEFGLPDGAVASNLSTDGTGQNDLESCRDDAVCFDCDMTQVVMRSNGSSSCDTKGASCESDSNVKPSACQQSSAGSSDTDTVARLPSLTPAASSTNRESSFPEAITKLPSSNVSFIPQDTASASDESSLKEIVKDVGQSRTMAQCMPETIAYITSYVAMTNDHNNAADVASVKLCGGTHVTNNSNLPPPETAVASSPSKRSLSSVDDILESDDGRTVLARTLDIACISKGIIVTPLPKICSPKNPYSQEAKYESHLKRTNPKKHAMYIAEQEKAYQIAKNLRLKPDDEFDPEFGSYLGCCEELDNCCKGPVVKKKIQFTPPKATDIRDTEEYQNFRRRRSEVMGACVKERQAVKSSKPVSSANVGRDDASGVVGDLKIPAKDSGCTSSYAPTFNPPPAEC
jgi:hypothetical protein